MTLLKKWVDALRARLIDDVNRWWRLWSIRLAALGAVITAFVQWFPDTLSAVWNTIPPDMRELLPAPLLHSVPIILFVAVAVSRLVAQRKAKSDG
jgi:hypothetical protein